MKLTELKELIELVAARDIAEFELEEDGVKLRIHKSPAAPAVVPGVSHAPVTVQGVGHAPVVAMAPAPPAPAPAAVPAEPAPAEPEEGLFVVTAPMVGTFYRQPGPGAAPFTKKGGSVDKGQVLCIIEAMKLMNEIESEATGELVEIFVEDGQPVQFGDRLFAIREA